MSLLLLALLLASFGLFGFACGRAGDRFGGQWKAPHHWIYGLGISTVGIYFYTRVWGLALITYGLGVFISDFDDFRHGNFFGRDKKHKWEFWSLK